MFERYREIQMRRADGESPEHGFTLIELLIVIVVLGILAAIVVFSLTGVTGQSTQAACTSNGKTIEVAADAYQAEVGSYPTDQTDLTGGATQTPPRVAGHHGPDVEPRPDQRHGRHQHRRCQHRALHRCYARLREPLVGDQYKVGRSARPAGAGRFDINSGQEGKPL